MYLTAYLLCPLGHLKGLTFKILFIPLLYLKSCFPSFFPISVYGTTLFIQSISKKSRNYLWHFLYLNIYILPISKWWTFPAEYLSNPSISISQPHSLFRPTYHPHSSATLAFRHLLPSLPVPHTMSKVNFSKIWLCYNLN